MVAKMEQYREKKSEGEVTQIAKPKAVTPMEMPQNPSSLHINMKQHNLGDVSVGQTMKMVVHGKVIAHNHDKYGHTVNLAVHKISSNDSADDYKRGGNA